MTVALSTYNNAYSTILTDAKGYTYVFYESQNPSALSTVFLNVTRYYDHYPFSPFMLPVQRQGTWTVNATGQTPLFGSTAAAAIDPSSGALYVAWTRSSIVTGSSTIILSKSVNRGQTWTSSVVHTLASSQGDDQSPSIAVAPSGTIYVAFLESWTTGIFAGINAVSAVSSTNGGTSFSPLVNITTGTTGFLSGTAFTTPSVAVDSHSRAYVAYGSESYFVLLNNASAYVSWSDGTVWSAPARVSSGAAWGDNPTVAVDSSDHVHVAWLDYRQVSGGNTIHYRQSVDRGATWGADQLVMSGFYTTASSAVPVVSTFANTVQITMAASPSNQAFEWTWSQDGGVTWVSTFGFVISPIQPIVLRASAGGNNTYWITYTDNAPATKGVYLEWWEAPPSTPVITEVAPGTGSLTVSWAASPEADISYFQVSRSTSNGGTWTAIANVAAPATSFVDSGLANGTYYYQVTAVDSLGMPSNPSQAASGTVGPTTQALIDQLQGEIASLQDQLAEANASSAAAIASARAEITSLQNQLTNLQNSQATSNAATAAALAQLQANITALQQKLNDLQSQQATQTISYANLAFEVIVVVLLVVLLLNQMRKPKVPQMMMAQPAQAPKTPEDDL